MLLICAGIFGGSALLMQSPWLLALVTWGGVAFLLWYGFGALKTAMSSNLELASAEVMKQGRWKIIVTMLAVTWLNPHVYLDTFVVLGSLGGQLDVGGAETLVCARHGQRLFPVVLRSCDPGCLAGAAPAHRAQSAAHH